MLKSRLDPCLGSTASPRPSQEQAVPDLRAGIDFANAPHHASCRSWEGIASLWHLSVAG
jgi:hypothetical protein